MKEILLTYEFTSRIIVKNIMIYMQGLHIFFKIQNNKNNFLEFCHGICIKIALNY